MTSGKSILSILILITFCLPHALLGSNPLEEGKKFNDSLSINRSTENRITSSIHSATSEADAYTFTVESIKVDDWLTIDDVTPELSPKGRIPLLLIHGWNFGDQTPTPPGFGYWEYFKNYIMNNPELRKYFKPYYVKYWSNAVSVKQLGGLLRDKIEQAGLHEKPLVLIGHSMGGLVSRSFMNEYSFNTGTNAAKKCGDIVKLLITLGSPHHGSPMANGLARDDKVSFLMKIAMATVESLAFRDIKYNEQNRSDLHWDNYDGLLNYTKYSSEKNDWLSNLNLMTEYEPKLICYASTVTGEFNLSPSGVDEQYQMGSYLMKESFKFNNDGIVPIQSSMFAGHTPKKVRTFSEYNHADIVKGKVDRFELFNPLRDDLLEVVPPQIIWPSEAGIIIKHSQTRTISWDAPSSVKNVNIYFSGDKGQTYNLLANNIDASLKAFQWLVPDTNLTQCVIKITNASNESEFTSSINPFTIYHNRLTIENPVAKTYFVPDQTNTISWKQYGIAPAVRITYLDPKNNFKKVIAEELSVNQNSNIFDWAIDNSIPPSDYAFVQIELLKMNELYSDDENYVFTSSPFMMLGEPKITINAPSAYSKDEFGIEGEKMVIDAYYTIRWQTEGDIKNVRISLCDSSKNIIRELETKIHQPGIHSNGFFNWKIPPVYGDKFYLLLESGPNPNMVNASTYSQYPFRINRNISIATPFNGSNNMSLLPCIEVEPVSGATGYLFELKDKLSGGTEYNRTFRSTSTDFCMPNSLENELLPGMICQLTTFAFFDTIKSYPSRIVFQTIKEKPLYFQTLLPIEGVTIEGDNHTFKWKRAVGAQEYQIDISNQKKVLFSDIVGRSDTSILVNLGKSGIPDTLFWNVTARNDYGETVAKSFFFNINQSELGGNENFNLIIYPNPFETETIIEYELPVSVKIYQIEITLYDLTGKKIRSLAKATQTSGRQKLEWDGKDESGRRVAKGVYIGCLIVNQESVTRSIIVI